MISFPLKYFEILFLEYIYIYILFFKSKILFSSFGNFKNTQITNFLKFIHELFKKNLKILKKKNE